MEIETIRRKVRNGDYLVRSHAVLHALKEGFVQREIIDAVENGNIIEVYPNDKRVICGVIATDNISEIVPSYRL